MLFFIYILQLTNQEWGDKKRYIHIYINGRFLKYDNDEEYERFKGKYDKESIFRLNYLT